MVTQLTRTGIDVIGAVPWGTHFCLFYETKEDLLDILIPYFKAGLENNEFCLWVHSEIDKTEEAIAALRRAMPGVDRHLAAGDIEILPHTEWYLKDRTFDPQRVMNGWNEKLADALAMGYAGMRVSANEAWLTEKRWKDFMEYEDKLKEIITDQRMIGLCTYPLAKSRAAEVFDAAHTHDFTSVRRNGNWEVLETPELKQAKSELRKANERLEHLVHERTKELTATTEELRRQISGCELAEEALKRSEGELRTLFAAMTDVVLVLDADGRYVKIAPTNPLNLYRPSKDLLGKNIHQILPKEEADNIFHQIGRVLESRQTVHFEYRLNIGSSEMWFEGKISPLTKDTVFWISRDITERKKLEEERKRLEERLQRAEKMESLGLMAGGIAHDLNNSLGILIGYSELLLNKLEESSPIRFYATTIMDASERAAATIQDMLTLARRGVQAREVVNLNSIILDFLKTPEFENLSTYRPNLKVKTNMEKEPFHILGSPVHLGKTILNLVSNAAEATLQGGLVTITTSNQYLDRPVQGYDEIMEGDYVVLSVSDLGEGIPDHNIKQIFEPFYTKKVMGRSGTGLGLAVVWGTVKDHNGYIDVQSEEGKGSTFTLYFPITREELFAESTPISASEYMGHGESILIVDDVAGQRELAAEMLRGLNYNVTVVSSGEDAVAYLKEHTVDLMVLDMIMDPGMDGLDSYRSILDIRPKQKAIIVSGFSETDRVHVAQTLGAGAYVKKPYIKDKLGLAVRKELDEK